MNDRMLALSSEDPIDWILCVVAHHCAKDSEKAYEIACKGIRRFPENAALQVCAGDICRELKRYEEAFVYWQGALKLDSSLIDARYSMGFCHEALGHYREALSIWTELNGELLRRGFVHECELPAKRAKFCEERIM